jgi:hypothetical protein
MQYWVIRAGEGGDYFEDFEKDMNGASPDLLYLL